MNKQLWTLQNVIQWPHNGKVNRTSGHEGLDGEYSYSCTLSSTSVLDGGGWSPPNTGSFTSRNETLYPLYRRLGCQQGRSGYGKSPTPNGCRSPDRPASTVVDPGTHSHVIATISWGVSSSSVGHVRSSSDLVRNFFLNKVIYETWRWSLILLFQVQNYSWITKNFEHYCFKFVGAEFKSTMICQSEM